MNLQVPHSGTSSSSTTTTTTKGKATTKGMTTPTVANNRKSPPTTTTSSTKTTPPRMISMTKKRKSGVLETKGDGKEKKDIKKQRVASPAPVPLPLLPTPTTTTTRTTTTTTTTPRSNGTKDTKIHLMVTPPPSSEMSVTEKKKLREEIKQLQTKKRQLEVQYRDAIQKTIMASNKVLEKMNRDLKTRVEELSAKVRSLEEDNMEKQAEIQALSESSEQEDHISLRSSSSMIEENDITQFISDCWDSNTLDAIRKALRMRLCLLREMKICRIRSTLRENDQVTWNSKVKKGRKGVIRYGTIEKVCKVNCRIIEKDTLREWTVPIYILTKVVK